MANRPKFPLWVIFLDVAGTLLVAGGLFGLFAENNLPVAGVVDLRLLAVPLIILGVLLMAPLVIYAVKPAR